jgi:hypothetical protein
MITAERGSRGCGLVQVQGAGVPDAYQPHPADSDGGGREKNGREVAARVGFKQFPLGRRESF